jgi:hypothetical protein
MEQDTASVLAVPLPVILSARPVWAQCGLSTPTGSGTLCHVTALAVYCHHCMVPCMPKEWPMGHASHAWDCAVQHDDHHPKADDWPSVATNLACGTCKAQHGSAATKAWTLI